MFQDTTQNQPVTVLGKTFNSEEERRNYFREELRKQLPELKKMEGFPIGEDEDIINLSDPPFYTACPNPWLNDFIAEWEEEKQKLEKKGLRSTDFGVTEPFAYDISIGKNNPIYNAHGYHTKVPHLAILRYLMHYTQPGDIIFDGFSGTGMTGVASSLCGNIDNSNKLLIDNEFRNIGATQPIWGDRKCILAELAPIASFIGYNYNLGQNPIKINNEAKKILLEVEKEFNWMYETIHHENNKKGRINYVVWSDVFLCPECSTEFVFWDVAVDLDKGKIRDSFNCSHCNLKLTKSELKKSWTTSFDSKLGISIEQTRSFPVLINYSFENKRYEKRPDKNDLNLIEKISDFKTDYWYPTDELPLGEKTKEPKRTHGVSNVHQFFTKRNLIIISALWSKSGENSHLRWMLTGIMLRASIQHQIAISRVGGEKAGDGGKTAGHRRGTIAIPSNKIEYNVFKLFSERLAIVLKSINEKKDIDVIIETISSTNLIIANDSVDYLFVDPPFGANIMYSELNFLWDSWLKVKTNNESEAIENKTQGKGTFEYSSLMTKCFIEYFRILKPGKWMTVEFSNTSAAIWNSIQTSIQRSGFVIANVSALDKKQQTHNSRVTQTAVKQDLVISCYKPSSEFDQKFKKHQHLDVALWDFVEEHLNHLPVHLIVSNSTTAIYERSPKILFDRLISFYVQKSLPVPIDAGKFQLGLREHFIERDGMFFTNEQVQEYDLKKKEVPNFVQLSILVSSEQDGVLWLKNFLQENLSSYQDIQPQWLQALAGVRKGDVIPELAIILEENFLKDEKGKWYVPNPENEIDLEKLRSKRLQKQFETYKTEVLKPKGKLKEVRVDALRAGFKQCYQDKDFKTIVTIGDRIPNNLLMEDEVLLQFYDIASSRV
jgi:DNA modification methylase